jgi:Glycosyl transferase family 11
MHYTVTNLMGGLGNQMFQYAAGRSLSLSTSRQLFAAADQFDVYKDHNGYEINRVFQLGLKVAPNKAMKDMLGVMASPQVRRLISKRHLKWLRPRSWLDEENFASFSMDSRLNPYMHGYWQSEAYFAEHAQVIREDFQFALPMSPQDVDVAQRMKAAPSASIHVRRGDYTTAKNQGIYTQCDLAYYLRATRLLEQQHPDLRYFIFSDAPEWVSQHLLPSLKNAELVGHNVGDRAAMDMKLMSSARHHIIANSTFSWWAAWLNPDPDKLVVAPRHWFTDPNRGTHIIPQSWKRV